jgi:hypothetical protein
MGNNAAAMRNYKLCIPFYIEANYESPEEMLSGSFKIFSFCEPFTCHTFVTEYNCRSNARLMEKVSCIYATLIDRRFIGKLLELEGLKKIV